MADASRPAGHNRSMKRSNDIAVPVAAPHTQPQGGGAMKRVATAALLSIALAATLAPPPAGAASTPPHAAAGDAPDAAAQAGMPPPARPARPAMEDAQPQGAQGLRAGQKPLWELGLGLGALHLPHYRGSDQHYAWVLPLPFAVYRGEVLKADREGARAVLAEGEHFDFDLSLAAAAPTSSKDNLARQGMADLDPVVELGPNLNLRLAQGAGWRVEARLPVRAAFTVSGSPRHLGWIAMPRLALDADIGRWEVAAYASWVSGDRRLHGYYYDVPVADATADRPAYRAAGGSAGSQWTLGASRRYARHWVGVFVRYDRLHGAAFVDSPLVRQRDNVTAGLALSWILAQSRRVGDED
jgi:outer membrane scaffolding protein for murein synthesis (MipA/OmpV family)